MKSQDLEPGNFYVIRDRDDETGPREILVRLERFRESRMVPPGGPGKTLYAEFLTLASDDAEWVETMDEFCTPMSEIDADPDAVSPADMNDLPKYLRWHRVAAFDELLRGDAT